MDGSQKYTSERRAAAIEAFHALVADGLSQRRARAEVGQRFGVSDSTLRN